MNTTYDSKGNAWDYCHNGVNQWVAQKRSITQKGFEPRIAEFTKGALLTRIHSR